MPTSTTAASPPSASPGDQWFDTANGNRRCECTAVASWNAVTGFTGWTATNATSAVTASWVDASDALAVTASGGGNWLAASPAQAVSPGDVVSATAELYSPAVTLNDASLGIAWLDGSGTQIGSPTLGTVAALAAGTPGTYTVTGTAPGSAASFTLQPGDAETPAAGTQMAIQNAVATTWAPYQAGTNAIANAAVTAGQVAGSAIQAGAVAPGAIDGTTVNAMTMNGGTISASDVLISGNGGGLFVYSSGGQITQTLTGSGTWVCPAGVTSVMAECWGGGGGGGGSVALDRGGGGGGEYAAEPALAVTPGNSYAYTAGAAGNGGSTTGNGSAGGNSTFAGNSVTVTAHGGQGGASVSSGNPGGTGSVNTVHFDGGDGTLGFSSDGGGGGGSGGTSSAGNAGGTPVGASAVTGGGPGGQGGSSSGANGSAPSTGPGGGGGGGGKSGGGGGSGGNGFHGKVRLTYTSASPVLIGSIAGAAGTADPVAGVAYPEGVASDHVTLTTVTAVPATPTLGCVLYYKSGALWALGPSGTPVSLATT